MKRLLIISMLIVFVLPVCFAQQENINPKSKKDFSEIFPQKGDYVLGVDLAGFIKVINNSITNTNAGNPISAFQSDLFGKYYFTPKNAIRARLGIYLNHYTNREYVRDDNAFLNNPLADPLTYTKVVDEMKYRNNYVELGLGYECRRTLWRLQGYVGGEIFGGFNSYNKYFKYGNPITEVNQNPSTLSSGLGFFNNASGYRVLEYKGGSTINYGISALTGVDLFLSRNISIGVEFQLKGNWSYTCESNAISETWLLDQVYTTEEKIDPVSTGFQLVPTGYFSLMFYF